MVCGLTVSGLYLQVDSPNHGHLIYNRAPGQTSMWCVLLIPGDSTRFTRLCEWIQYHKHYKIIHSYCQVHCICHRTAVNSVKEQCHALRCARPLVKIGHVIFIYVTTPHSECAVLAITHENRALLTCIACSELQIFNTALGQRRPRAVLKISRSLYSQRVRVFVNKTLTTVSNPKILNSCTPSWKPFVKLRWQ